MKRPAYILLMAIIATIGWIVYDLLAAAGSFKDIKPHFLGSAEKIPIPVSGPEDITLDTALGLAFISADDRRSNQKSPGSVNGAILVMRLDDGSRTMRNVTPSTMTDFHPHGIALWVSPEKRRFLFAISHRTREYVHAVERFEWRNDSLIHLESIVDMERMTSPNDLVATGERSFYATNDHFHGREGLAKTLEDYLRRAISFVNFYDGKSFRKVATGIAYANGINMSPDGSKVYVAATTGRKLLTYKRDASDGSLTLLEETDLETGVDNIELDEKGDLWIGCHPQMLKFVAHAADARKRSPSQVLHLRHRKGGGYDAREVFLNDGKDYSGSTVATVYRDRMLIGSVFEGQILDCRMASAGKR